MNTEEQVLKIIEADFKKSEKEIRSAKKWSDLDLDSLDTVELIMKIEEQFDIMFDDEETQGINTMSELVQLIESKRS
jgi:acyl carrier protein